MINLNLLLTLAYIHSGAFLMEHCDLTEKRHTVVFIQACVEKCMTNSEANFYEGRWTHHQSSVLSDSRPWSKRTQAVMCDETTVTTDPDPAPTDPDETGSEQQTDLPLRPSFMTCHSSVEVPALLHSVSTSLLRSFHICAELQPCSRSSCSKSWSSGTWESGRRPSSSGTSTRSSPSTTGPPSGWTSPWRCCSGTMTLWSGSSCGT